jgi:N4-gp56 family major capsid protein
MHPWAEFDMRTNTSTGQWLDIQKAAAAAEGRASPLFKGSLGMYHDVILHKHRAAIRFNDYGAGGNVNAVRNLFMGRQAAVMAFGLAGHGPAVRLARGDAGTAATRRSSTPGPSSA